MEPNRERGKVVTLTNVHVHVSSKYFPQYCYHLSYHGIPPMFSPIKSEKEERKDQRDIKQISNKIIFLLTHKPLANFHQF